MSKRLKTWFVLTLALGAAGCVARASAQDASGAVMKWVNANAFAYKSYMQYAQHPPAAEVPVPPELDPPCHLCGDTSKSASETQVDAWVKQNQNPEMQYATELLRMSHELTQLEGLNQAQLSPAARAALAHYYSVEARNAAKSLALRLYNAKAAEMARRYDKEPKRAYAGIKFLMETSRNVQLLGGSDPAWIDGPWMDNDALQLAETWENSVAEKIDQEILSGHKYNLCPVYASVMRSVELLGGQQTDMARFNETLNKMDKLLHFNVSMDMNLSSSGNNGGHMNVSWTANGKLHIKIDGANACYTPEMENGGQMHVNITNFDMAGRTGEPVNLVSSRSFDVPFKAPSLNMCDEQAQLMLPFNAMDFEKDEIEAHGQTSTTGSFFGAFLTEVVMANNIGSAQTNAMSGRTPDPGPAPANSGVGNNSMDAMKAQMEAHKNDPGWFMSSEGQKAMADFQKQVVATTRQAAAAKGVQLPNAGSLTDLANSVGSVRIKWSNGSTTPAQDTFRSNKDGQTLTLKVSVESQQ